MAKALLASAAARIERLRSNGAVDTSPERQRRDPPSPRWRLGLVSHAAPVRKALIVNGDHRPIVSSGWTGAAPLYRRRTPGERFRGLQLLASSPTPPGVFGASSPRPAASIMVRVPVSARKRVHDL